MVMKILFFISLILFVVLVVYKFTYLRRKSVKKKLPPMVYEYKELIKESLETKNISCADQAYQNLILFYEHENPKSNYAYIDELKNLRSEYSLFKKKYDLEEQKTTSFFTTTNREMRNEYIQHARFLSKEATKQKSNDISQAVRLIQEAVNINPLDNEADHLKLANYLHQQGRKDEAYEIYSKIISKKNANNVFFYHKSIADVLEKICIRKLSDRDYDSFIINHLLFVTISLLADGIKNDSDNLERTLSENSLIKYVGKTRFDSYAKKAGLEKSKAASEKLNDFIEQNKTFIVEMSRIAEDIIVNVPYKKGIDRYKKINRKLTREPMFMKLYNKFSYNKLSKEFRMLRF